MNETLKSWLPHVIAIAVFVLIGLTYFSPLLEGKRLSQGDTRNFLGMAKEIRDHREVFDDEPLWTNSMFGGMPAYQIAVKYPGAVLKHVDKALQLWTPRPMNYVLLYMIGFYILMMSLRINPWLAVLGSVAFAFSSYFFIIIEAGHNTKAHAIAYMAPALAGILMAYRGKIILGGALTALFMALQIQANHVQVTYYFGMMVGIIALVKLIDALRNKQIASWLKPSAVLLGAVFIGVMCNIANLWNTYEYGQFTTRGPSELTILPSGQSNEAIATSGLDRDYITRWSYGISETLSLVIPNAKGGASGVIGERNKHLSKASPGFRQNIAGSNHYWGNQPFTSGPVYVGALVFYLFILGMVLLKGNFRWAILATVILTIMLSWGKNFMPLTDLFLDYVPGYNKFRAVTIILAITELAIPLLAVLFLNHLIRHPEQILEQKKKFYIASGISAGGVLLLALSPGMFLSFLSDMELQQFEGQITQQSGQQAAMIGAFMEELETVRQSIFRADAFRSLAFIAAGVALIFLFMRQTISQYVLIGGLMVLVLGDMWAVNKRYLSNEKDRGRYVQWEDPADYLFPFPPAAADIGVLQNETNNRTGLLRMAGEDYSNRSTFEEQVEQHKAIMKKMKADNGAGTRPLTDDESNIARLSALNFQSNFRVLNLNNPFNDGRTPYLHKSIGGYHGAKLKRYQELIDFHLGAEVSNLMGLFGQQPTQEQIYGALRASSMLNMLNTRYLIYSPDAPPLVNSAALGSAWVVDEVALVENADAEILATGEINPSTEAIADKRFADYFGSQTTFAYDSLASVRIMSYKPNELTYDFRSSETQFVVFSEIHYDAGWQAYLNNEPVDHVRVNYLLRGMKVPPGNHTIVFKFEPMVFATVSTVASVSAILLLLLFGFVGFRSIREMRSPKED